MDICLNCRVLGFHLTGVQRYVFELLNRFGGAVDQIAPGAVLHGMKGHLWEQLVLPKKVGDRLLWSPSNAGPLAVEKQVLTMHDIVVLDHPEWFGSRFAAWYDWMTPKLVKRVRRIIAVSEFTKLRLMDRLNVPSEKIVVIPNGVDKRFFPHSPSAITKAREHLNINYKYYILALGSVEPRKGLKRLLEVWGKTLPNIPDDVGLVVAGAKGASQVFRSLSLNHVPPRVCFTGHVRDELLPALISGAMAFVYLSEYEGFGLPPLEAMACGTPVLTSDLTAIPEVVADAAIAVNPFDAEAIANGLHLLIYDNTLREGLKKAGIKQAERFSWDVCATQTWAALKSAL